MSEKPIDYTAFRKICREGILAGRYQDRKKYISHSDVSVFSHCLKVAFVAYTFAVRHRIRCDLRALVRGALLHDYYLYDWHDPNKGFRWHGFKHHRFALFNARRDYQLSGKEENIIYAHMFPLTVWCLPKSREAWLVTLADKTVAAAETLKKYKNARRGSAT